ncbi:DUF1540 domain-containing protein [Demequina sp. NBRC 110056]|uniref:DUF1540 domain-containing protein n=1 Tax=Demequina sp. NBRC 110056 TaxID=1570345 RepID=UPI000A04E36F|nr:DUF1540 domain-containing protein [Demequina sp. NBRC 110056]
MATMISLPIVSSCSVETCGFNHDGCHAGAINVSGDHAHCSTFVDTDHKSGKAGPAGVGACTRTDCKFNDEMSCTAEAIEVGASFDTADCLTFEAR